MTFNVNPHSEGVERWNLFYVCTLNPLPLELVKSRNSQ